jgi:NAD(P)-dependent dehydrogenase (short-subunit alcohol dehydrogenase family)
MPRQDKVVSSATADGSEPGETHMTKLHVLIVGASSGIGEALAIQYAKSGAALALFARRRDRLDAVAAAAQKHGAASTVVLVGDTTDQLQVAAAYAQLTSAWPHIDRAYLNAGGGGGASEWLVTECCDVDGAQPFSAQATLDLMQLNFAGPVFWLEHLLAAPQVACRRVIALTGSMAADGLLLRSGPYMASKMAVRGLVYGLRERAADRGVFLALIEPGFVDTAQGGGKHDLPFLMSADEAATTIVAGIESGQPSIRVPWQLSVANRLAAWLPRSAYVSMIKSLRQWKRII